MFLTYWKIFFKNDVKYYFKDFIIETKTNFENIDDDFIDESWTHSNADAF